MHFQEIALVEKLAECRSELQMANKGKITGLEKALVCKTEKIMLPLIMGVGGKLGIKRSFSCLFFNNMEILFLPQFWGLTELSGAVIAQHPFCDHTSKVMVVASGDSFIHTSFSWTGQTQTAGNWSSWGFYR